MKQDTEDSQLHWFLVGLGTLLAFAFSPLLIALILLWEMRVIVLIGGIIAWLVSRA